MSDYIIAVPGDMKFRDVTVEENIGRTNYREANNIDYLDGDFNSSLAFGLGDEGRQDDNRMYDYGSSSCKQRLAFTKVVDGTIEHTG